MKNEKKLYSINWLAVVGFFFILGYMYLVFATYNNVYPSLNEKLSDDYPPFENPGGRLGTAVLSSLIYLGIKTILLGILAGVLFGLFYCGQEVAKVIDYFFGKINKKIEQNEQKTKEETPKEKGPNTARNK